MNIKLLCLRKCFYGTGVSSIIEETEHRKNVSNFRKLKKLEKCKKNSIKDWKFNYATIKGDLYKYSRRFCVLEQNKCYNLPEEELIICRNYLQSFRTCIKLLIDKNK